MSGNRAKAAERRAELMAELLLEELGAVFVSRSTGGDVGFDLLAGFRNEQGGTNTFTVEVKATEEAAGSSVRLERKTFERLSRSNTPALLLLANVKEHRLYYGWLRQDGARTGKTVPVAVAMLDDEGRKVLREELTTSRRAMAAAG